MDSPINQDSSSPQSESKEPSQNGSVSDIAALKILVPRAVVGKLIGKGGSTIAQMQQETSAIIRISNPQTFFPNTQERILLIKTSPDNLMETQQVVINKFFEQVDNNGKNKILNTLHIVVPIAAAGHLIGQGGTTIKDLCTKSGARIQFASKDQSLVNGERVASIYGTPDVCIEAVSLIVEKMLEQPQYHTYKNLSLTYPNRLFSSNQFQPVIFPGIHQPQTVAPHSFPSNNFQNLPFNDIIHATTTIKMEINDEHVGAIIGKGGKQIIYIQQITGTKITLSKRDESKRNDDNNNSNKKRLLTIVGSSQTAVAAQNYISNLLNINFSKMSNNNK